MHNLTHVIDTFPSVSIPSESGGLPVEVSLIAQLGHGSGNHLYGSTSSRQKHHTTFIDALEEPSAKLGGMHLKKGDPSSLYSFSVGPKGHPFHRHAGHRIFTAISGSGGAQLRFCTASDAQVAQDPQHFIRAMRFINIPPDCLFTVRFGGETWHQFYPLSRNSLHPVFFALSCHTNELGGNLPEDLKQQVMANEATIPGLTELLPPEVNALLEAPGFDPASIPTTTLALDAPAGTFHRVVCNTVRSITGMIRGGWSQWANASGFQSYARHPHPVAALDSLSESSLLRQHLADLPLHHEDSFRLSLQGISLQNVTATQLLTRVLEGFLENPSPRVGQLMQLRNVLVKPLGLRTSPLGCPVSSLLSDNPSMRFCQRFPVLDQRVNHENTEAEVILGADDKHLFFRSCVGVNILDAQHAEVTLSNRVHCRKAFGHFYMAAIDHTHRRYVAPTMLRRTADYVVIQLGWNAPGE